MTSTRPARSISRSSGFFLATIVALFAVACQPTQQGQPEASTGNPPEVVTTVDIDEGENWDLIHIANEPIGHQVTRWRTIEANGSAVREVSADSSLKIRRFGQLTEQTMAISSRETLDGHMISFSTSISGGDTPLETTGRSEGGKLHLTTRSSGKTQSWSVAIPAHCGGLMAVEQSLLRAPMEPGEERSLDIVAPVLNVVASVMLRAGNPEETQLIQDSRELVRVTSDTQLPGGQTIRTIMWCDTSGRVLKTSVPAMNQTTYRVSKQMALETSSGAYDLGNASIVSVSKPLRNPHGTRRVQYRATLMNSDPTTTFVTTPYQLVMRLGERTAGITVVSVRPDTPVGETRDAPPIEADRIASPLIQSDDPAIRELAESISARVSDTDAWSLAVAVEAFVHDYVAEKNFTTAFATAADVARQRSGDCTEHAVLTAALCRALGVPARAVVGLVYVPSRQGFGFHMWNEVWIGDRWFPVDATIGRGGIGAAHLALARTSLPAEESFSGFLQVVRVIGQLQLEVLSVE